MAKPTVVPQTDADLAQIRTDLAALLARETSQKATVLAAETSDKAVSLSKETEQAAVALAEQRGVEKARTEERLKNHDEHFRITDNSIERAASGLENVGTLVTAQTVELRAMTETVKLAVGAMNKVDTRVDVLEETVTAIAAEKKGIVDLQSRQIIKLGTAGTVIYLLVSLIEHGHLG
jgi:L-lactate utilization protein LutC